MAVKKKKVICKVDYTMYESKCLVNVTNLNLPSCSRSVVYGQCTKLTKVLKEIRFYDVTRELLPIVLSLWTTPHIILVKKSQFIVVYV